MLKIETDVREVANPLEDGPDLVFYAEYSKKAEVRVSKNLLKGDDKQIIHDNLIVEVQFRVREDVFGTCQVGSIELTKDDVSCLVKSLGGYYINDLRNRYDITGKCEDGKELSMADNLLGRLFKMERCFV